MQGPRDDDKSKDKAFDLTRVGVIHVYRDRGPEPAAFTLSGVRLCGTASVQEPLVTLLSGNSTARGSVRALHEGFMSPPEDCRPGIWLMRFREETPDAVITYDLEHLAAAGLGEFCIYGYGNTSKKKAYGSLVLTDRPGVVVKLRKALSEAARLGLKMSICIGPAGCGNERTSPDNAMKVLADSRHVVEGGRRVKVRLPRCKVSDSPVDEAGLPKHWHDIGVFAVGSRIVEITERFDASRETVDWEASSGFWTLVRIGWVPKMFGWVGSYIDPLSREALDEHWGYCVAPLLNAATHEERRAFKGVLCDSWEGGDVSWTVPGWNSLGTVPAQTNRSANIAKAPRSVI